MPFPDLLLLPKNGLNCVVRKIDFASHWILRTGKLKDCLPLKFYIQTLIKVHPGVEVRLSPLTNPSLLCLYAPESLRSLPLKSSEGGLRRHHLPSLDWVGVPPLPLVVVWNLGSPTLRELVGVADRSISFCGGGPEVRVLLLRVESWWTWRQIHFLLSGGRWTSTHLEEQGLAHQPERTWCKATGNHWERYSVMDLFWTIAVCSDNNLDLVEMLVWPLWICSSGLFA